MTTKPALAGASESQGDIPGRGVCLGGSVPGARGPAFHPQPVWRRVSLDGLGATAGGTYASWDLLRLYFCITSWNRPLGAEVGALSGDTADLEGAGQE